MSVLSLLACTSVCLGSLPASSAARQDASAPRYALRVAEDTALELRASWGPCRSSTYGLFASTPALRSPAPARERERHDGELFRPFLPAAPVALGEVWEVESAAVLAFLRQFHAGAALQGHFNGGEVPGTRACLRAVSEGAFEILLRAHAVFELEDGVIYKPAQFEGRLMLERASGKLLAFQLALPSRDTNVDVNVPTEVESGGEMVQGISADIGWVPRMELSSGDPPPVVGCSRSPRRRPGSRCDAPSTPSPRSTGCPSSRPCCARTRARSRYTSCSCSAPSTTTPVEGAARA